MARLTIYAEYRRTVGEDLWRWVLESRLVHSADPIPREMPLLWTTRYQDHDGFMVPVVSEARHISGYRPTVRRR